jgi:hypothetical protein
MYTKNPIVQVGKPVAPSESLTRLAPGLTRLSAGLRVKTHIKAGPCGGACLQ